MERRRNKENYNPGRNMSIKDAFRVKKCLFHPSKIDFSSPNTSPLSASPTNQMELPNVESPFALFHIRKRRSQDTFMKSLHEAFDETPQKKSNSVKRDHEDSFAEQEIEKMMCSPVNSSSVKSAVQKAMADPSLSGNFSKTCILPTIEGRHPDLKTITPETVANLLNKLSEESLTFKLIDCRYPYEFDAGHIKTAVNMFNKSSVTEDLFSSLLTSVRQETAEVLIFYCEFSSERAPGMCRFLRNHDRDLNKDHYPFLFYPELYVLEGGYNAFFSTFQSLCEPQAYKPMLHKDNSEELSHYRKLCKSWSLKSKRGKRAKHVTQVLVPSKKF